MTGLRRVLAAGALATIAVGTFGCIEDSDCGICNPDSLILESISGINYASEKIHLLDPVCEGDRCPESFDKGTYFIEEIGPCEMTEDALESPRGTDEFCKISPLVTAFGIEFVFNNLLEPTSVELVRKRPDNPQLFEVYDFKTRVLDIEGPITRYNGDYKPGETDQPDVVTRLINLSCIDNLRAQGRTFSNADYEDPANNPCNTIDPNTGLPMKLFADGSINSYRARYTAGGSSCSTPEEGQDTCCSQCDFLLSTRVARYGLVDGVDPASNPPREQWRDPNPEGGNAITCDPEADQFGTVECRNFVPYVDRSLEERTYEYYWSCNPADPGCEPDTFPLPYYDKLRETHYDDRPAWLQNTSAKCATTNECTSYHDLPGTRCIGQLPSGEACSMDYAAECTEGRCLPQHFVACRADPTTTGAQGYCVDTRFSNSGTAACFIATVPYKALRDDEGKGGQGTGQPNISLAYCDGTENGLISAGECCQPALEPEIADGAECDPFYQEKLTTVSRYERDKNLPEQTKKCICELPPAEGCERVVERTCLDDNGNMRPEREGQYAVKFVSRVGGVVYDPAIKGFEWRPADVGGIPRASVESCAEDRGLIGRRNRHDGWRANDAFAPENYEDFDRAMCSDSTYTVRFSSPADASDGDPVEYVVDKVGNTLEGKEKYTFQTPAFHVVPGSGFPTDNLRIGACDDFSIRFSNKFDMSPENLRKLQLWRVEGQCGGDGAPCNNDADCGGDVACVNNLATPHGPDYDGEACSQMVPVAGGPGCIETRDALDAADDPCLPPCLTVDVENQFIGEVAVQIDPVEFGSKLEIGETYRLLVPGLGSKAEMSDPATYQAAFWDVCGMPLIVGETSEVDFLYDFMIDEPKCKEDADRDGIQRSCDNANDFFNPFQGDIDRDGWGDEIDVCPTLVNANNTGDSDNDGVGNDCDSCRRPINQYNTNADALALPAYMRVRNVPFQNDTDEDGIGDVCDNCIVVANCEDYGESSPWRLGDPIAYDNANICQTDNDADMIGDACGGGMIVGPNTDLPIGLGDDDDFDQDGIPNIEDGCPRQPVEFVACTGDAECGENRVCTSTGICNHLDSDGDDVGDICDTCAFEPNGMQIVEGSMQMDDEDGDFVGSVCETHNSCADNKDPRPFSFYEVSSNGLCCTVQLYEDADGNLRNVQTDFQQFDPDGLPIRTEANCSDADQDARLCRQLPTTVAERYGILRVPPGCDQALADAGKMGPLENERLLPEDFDGDLDALWQAQCFLPQFDQDFDGIGDTCDLCKFDFDPENLPYIDANGKLWPMYGKYCFGEYDIETKCGDEVEGTGGTGGTAGTGGMDTGGSGG